MSAVEYSEQHFAPPVLTWNPGTVKRAVMAACEAFGQDYMAVTGETIRPEVVRARHAAWWLLRRHVQPTPSYPELARALGRRDHVTVLRGLRKIDHNLATRSAYADIMGRAEKLFFGSA